MTTARRAPCRFINNGAVDVRGDFVTNGSPHFVNNGTFQVEHGTAQLYFQGSAAPEVSYVLGPEGTLNLSGYGLSASIGSQ